MATVILDTDFLSSFYKFKHEVREALLK